MKYNICDNHGMKKINPRYPLSLALKEEYVSRLELLRDKGFKISEIFINGIVATEKIKIKERQ